MAFSMREFHCEQNKGFVLLPKCWLVERTFGWFNWWRRLRKDDEILPETTEAFIYVALSTKISTAKGIRFIGIKFKGSKIIAFFLWVFAPVGKTQKKEIELSSLSPKNSLINQD
jgi:hypothetical protein